jgi:hypothetical protein
MKTNKFFISAIVLGVAFTAFNACSDDDDDHTSLPPIGGYNSADEVGSADLLAYWPLNGDGKESVSSTMPSSTVGAAYETGIKGQGVRLTAGYMKYPSITALASSLNNFSVSAWVKVYNNGTSASVFLSLAKPNDWAGNINFSAETGRPIDNDSIQFKGYLKSTSPLAGQDVVNIDHLDSGMIAENLITPGKHVAHPTLVSGQWAQAIITWDGTTKLFKLYCNGVKISNPAWELRGTPGDGNDLTFDTPTYPIIGAYSTFVDGTTTDTWNAPMTGSLDEMRMWKKTLSQPEITALYELELAGR